jgi:hypothetical protein
MLAVGGVVGYLIGHGNTRKRPVASNRHPGLATVVTRTVTVTTPGQTSPRTSTSTVTTPGKTVTRVRTVTTPGKTHVVHSTTTQTATRTQTATHTQTATRTATATSTVSAGASAGGTPQDFNGSGNESLGAITVTSASTLKWQCPECASGSFTITNPGDKHPSPGRPGPTNPNRHDFARAVPKLEGQLGRPPEERELAEELQWGPWESTLLGIAQAAQLAGLVALGYDHSSGRRYYYSTALTTINHTETSTQQTH